MTTKSPSLASKLRAQMMKNKNRPSDEDSCIESLLCDQSKTEPATISTEKHVINDPGCTGKIFQNRLKRKASPNSGASVKDSEDEDIHGNAKAKKRELEIDIRLSHIPEQTLSFARRLSEEAKSGSPPTPARVKPLGVKCLTLLLRYNDRPVYQGMGLDQLASMVSDYMKNGCPPTCPKCCRGKLRFSNWKKKFGKRYYWCPGSMTHQNAFYGCSFKANREQITRVPWKCP